MFVSYLLFPLSANSFKFQSQRPSYRARCAAIEWQDMDRGTRNALSAKIQLSALVKAGGSAEMIHAKNLLTISKTNKDPVKDAVF